MPAPSANGERSSVGLLHDSAWIVLGQGASALGLLVGTRLLTECVPPRTYGTVSLLLGLATIGRNLVCFPLLQAVLRFYADAARVGDTAGFRRLAGRLLARAVAWLGGAVLALGLVAARRLELSVWPFVVLALLLSVDVARTFETDLLNAARRQRSFAGWSAAEAWLRPGLAIGAVLLLGPTPQAMLLGYLASASVLYGLVRRTVQAPATAAEDPAQLGEWRRAILDYALPLAPLALAGWVASVGDRYIIATWLGAESVGLYAAAYGLASAPFLVLELVFEQSLRPVYFGAISAGDRPLERRLFRFWLFGTLIACAAGVAAIGLGRGVIARLALAPQYRAGAALLPWIAAGYGFHAVSYAYEKTCYAYRRSGWVTLINSVGAMVCLLVVPLAVPLAGLRGAAMAVPVYFGAQMALSVHASQSVRKNA